MGEMWGVFQNIEQFVARYSTIFGQFWYLLTFVFRLMVVVALGGSVYGDEKSSFTCVTNLPACGDQCYNQFAKISHMRFWSFQLLAVAFPAVLFHFYSTYIFGEIEKLKVEEDELKKAENDSKLKINVDKHKSKQQKREKKLGKYQIKRVYNDGSLKEVPVTRKIKLVYYMSVVCRAFIEIIFIYYAVVLYNYQDLNCNANPDGFNCPYIGFFNFLWMTVPTQFTCDDPSVRGACSQHFTLTNSKWSGHVICFIARPFEKSIFLRYMQILSCICFFLCVAEIIYIPFKEVFRRKSKQRRIKKNSHLQVTVSGNNPYLPQEVTLMDELNGIKSLRPIDTSPDRFSYSSDEYKNSRTSKIREKTSRRRDHAV